MGVTFLHIKKRGRGEREREREGERGENDKGGARERGWASTWIVKKGIQF